MIGSEENIIEKIDIGGISLIRAAAYSGTIVSSIIFSPLCILKKGGQKQQQKLKKMFQ